MLDLLFVPDMNDLREPNVRMRFLPDEPILQCEQDGLGFTTVVETIYGFLKAPHVPLWAV